MNDIHDICGNLNCSNLVRYGENLCWQCKTGKPKQVSNPQTITYRCNLHNKADCHECFHYQHLARKRFQQTAIDPATTKEIPETPRKRELVIPKKYEGKHCSEICQECFVRYGYCQAAAIRNGIKSIMYKDSIEDTPVHYEDSLQTGLDRPRNADYKIGKDKTFSNYQ